MKVQFENISFKRGLDPKIAMGLGMREKIKKMMIKDNWSTFDDNEALKWSSKYNHIDIVKWLLEAGVDIHIQRDWPLRAASHNGHLEVIKLLLDTGADIHADADYSLRWASGYGFYNLVKLLLKRGADVHASDNEPLKWALRNDHTKVANLLKKYGAVVKVDDLKTKNLKFLLNYKPKKEYLKR